jgi:hypothetical protein
VLAVAVGASAISMTLLVASAEPAPSQVTCAKKTCSAAALCFDQALPDLLTNGNGTCQTMVVPDLAGPCPADLAVKADGKAVGTEKATCTASDGGKVTLSVDLQKSDFTSFAGKTSVVTIGVMKPTSVTFPSSASPTNEHTAGTDGTSATDAGSRQTAKTEGADGGMQLTPVDVAPRICTEGGGISADVQWVPASGTTPQITEEHAANGTPKSTMITNGLSPKARATTDECTGPLKAAASHDHGERVFVVDEDLQVRAADVDPPPSSFVTDSDVIVVRFLVRRALACRTYATSDTSNKYDGSTFKVGGQTALSGLPNIAGFKFTSATGGQEKVYSCDEELVNLSASQDPGVPAQFTTNSNEYVTVDYRFGPFTSSNVILHLHRHDRTLGHDDMTSTLTLPNHARYNGWFDVVLGANMLGAPEGSVYTYRSSGDATTMLGRNDRRVNYDIGVVLKLFMKCTNDSASWLNAVDVTSSPLCLGLSAGLSFAHPLRTFYPIGVNVTLNRFFSLQALLTLNRFQGLAPGYVPGAVYSGDTSTIPSQDRYVLGGELAFGLDPSLFASLLKGVVTGGK